MMALRKADIGEFYRRTNTLYSIYRLLLVVTYQWAQILNVDIQDSLRTIGGNATGTGSTLTPSGVVDIGFRYFLQGYYDQLLSVVAGR